MTTPVVSAAITADELDELACKVILVVSPAVNVDCADASNVSAAPVVSAAVTADALDGLA